MMRSLLRFTLRTLLTLALVAFIGLAIAVRFSWVTFTQAQQERLEENLLLFGLPLVVIGVLVLIFFPRIRDWVLFHIARESPIIVRNATILITLMFGFTISLMAFLRIPVVQTKLTRYVTNWFYEQTHYPVRIGRVNYRFPDNLILEKVSIPDTLRKPMIEVKRLEVNLALFKLIDSASTNIHLDQVKLVGPDIRLVVQPNGDLNIDGFINAIDRLTAPKTPRKGPPKVIPFTIGEGLVEAGEFHYDDPRKEPFKRKGTFDYNHFVIHELNGNVKNFLVFADTIAADITQLRGIDRVAQLRIHKFDTKFFFSAQQMRFENLLVHVNRSTLRKHIEFRYNRSRDLGDFNEKVRIIADLNQSVVYANDLARFASSLYQFNDRWQASGHFDGTVRDFVFNATDLRYGKQSRAAGTFAFKGLPDFETSDMDFRLSQFVTNAQDLAQYTGKTAEETIREFGTLDYQGLFAGRYNDFRAKGTLKTGLGTIVPDLSMKIADVIENSTYKGNIELADFALGDLIKDPNLLQSIDLKGQIEGAGFDKETATVKLNTDVKQFGFQGYNYRNIRVDGALQLGLFEGKVAMKDTNLVFDLEGKADLRQKRNYFDIDGTISRAMLHPLGVSEEDMRLQSEVHVVWTGLELDQMYGVARLKNTYLTRMLEEGDRNLLIDTLYLFVPKPVSSRYISLQTDILNATVEGPFALSQALKDLPNLVEEYKIYFTELDSTRQDYYRRKAKKSSIIDRYSLDYSVDFKDARPLMAFLYPGGYLSPNTRVEGAFTMGATSVFSFNAKVDTLLVERYKFYHSEIDLNTSKYATQNDVLASAVITSQQQQIYSAAPTEDLQVEASWEKDHIAFTSRLRQQQSTNRLNLNGDIFFRPEGTDLHFRRSRVRILDQDWNVNTENRIRLTGSNIEVSDLTFRNVEQSIAINGMVSKDPLQILSLKAQDFNLATLQPILQVNVKGTLNGELSMRDAYENINLDGNLNVDELVYKGFLIGNVTASSQWDRTNQRVNINMGVDRMNNPILNVKGTYAPEQDENSLDLVATLNRTDLQIFEPFTEDLFSEIKGQASGKLLIRGTPRDPKLGGLVDVKRGQLRFDYLGVRLAFSDTIRFRGGEIQAQMGVSDEEGNTGKIRLGMYSGGNGSYALDLKASLKNFKVLNTTSKDNKLFYGKAYVTGDVSVESVGSLDNLIVKSNATTRPGTEITIPIDNASEVSNTDYIQFVNLAIKKKVEEDLSLKRRMRSGIRMDFNFNITPDAKCILLLDRRTGDRLEAYGHSNLNLEVDTKGEFAMRGTYELEKGKYYYKYEALVSKEFAIQPNSRISWYGDPYEAYVDVKASYTKLTSLTPIMNLTNDQTSSAQARRAYPVEVTISLKDRLMKPNVGFGLKIKEYPLEPQFSGSVQAFEARIANDEQELNNQVSSILFSGRLIPQNSQAFRDINVLNLLAETGTSVLSDILSKVANGVEVDINTVNVIGSNQNLADQLRARVSYNFGNGLTISRDGGFSSVYSTQNANLIGDWAAEWTVTPDARWRLKAFSRFPQNTFLQSTINQNTPTVGGSVLYTKSFNYFFPKKKVTPSAVTPTDTTRPDTTRQPARTTEAYKP
ncbi:translocation/assembly module TamB domain-containing protein [Siphonobacter sp.]|uniref:translocation/assembly module TamB domain-containing protein n=1 Tax=Siphonobacter sp. TaxID=1869184 RepID=UPI003B3B08D4